MKQIITALLVLLVLMVIGAYVFLPATQKSEASFTIKANHKALQRTLLQHTVVYQKNSGNATKSLIPPTLKLYPGVFDEFVMVWQQNREAYNSRLKLLSLGIDSTVLYWNGIIQGGNAPWERVASYLRMRKMRQEAERFMTNLKPLEQQERLYGFKVTPEKVRDSVMMSTRFTTTAYPQTADIYKHISLLQDYVNAAGATSTNYPMLHIKSMENGYETQVALPTNKALPGKGNIELKRMVMGNILTTEVQGGQAKVQQAMQVFDNFVTENGFVSPAIPFASLVTDRTEEKDSTKWVTRLYYPVY